MINYIKARIDQTQQNKQSRFFSDEEETNTHIISECIQVTKKGYKVRHDWEISTKGKTIQTKQDIPKRGKKILPTTGRRWRKNIPTSGCKSNRIILEKIWQPIEHNGQAEWINNMNKELEGLEESPKAELHIDLF